MSRPILKGRPSLPAPILVKRTRYRVRKLFGEWWAEEWLIVESPTSPHRHGSAAMIHGVPFGRGREGWRMALCEVELWAHGKHEPPC